MQAVMKGTVAPIVEIVDGIPTVLSTNVAAVFENETTTSSVTSKRS